MTGTQLKRIRTFLDIKQSHLAESVGTSQGTISKMEECSSDLERKFGNHSKVKSILPVIKQKLMLEIQMRISEHSKIIEELGELLCTL